LALFAKHEPAMPTDARQDQDLQQDLSCAACAIRQDGAQTAQTMLRG
jgi:hypothetical protein